MTILSSPFLIAVSGENRAKVCELPEGGVRADEGGGRARARARKVVEALIERHARDEPAECVQ